MQIIEIKVYGLRGPINKNCAGDLLAKVMEEVKLANSVVVVKAVLPYLIGLRIENITSPHNHTEEEFLEQEDLRPFNDLIKTLSEPVRLTEKDLLGQDWIHLLKYYCEVLLNNTEL